MKLLHIGPPGEETTAAIDGDGTLRDLSKHVDDIAGAALLDESLDQLRALDLSSLPALPAGSRIDPCVGNVGKFMCIGLNSSDHASKSGMKVPVYLKRGQVMELGIEGLGSQWQTVGQA